MSISSIASNIWSAATTALTTPNSATAPVSLPSTKSNGSTATNGTTATNATTGSSNPFQALSPDMQSWLNQNQSTGSAAHIRHHHHHGDGTNQATQSYAASDALSTAPEPQPATA
jgi:hypothetical protein